MKISKRAEYEESSSLSYDDVFLQVKDDWETNHSLLGAQYSKNKDSFIGWVKKQNDYVNIYNWKPEYIKNILNILSKNNHDLINEDIFKKITFGHSIFIEWWKKNHLLINDFNNGILKDLDSLSISIGLDCGFWTSKALFSTIYKSIISYFGDKIVENKYQVNIDDKVNISDIIEESKKISKENKDEKIETKEETKKKQKRK